MINLASLFSSKARTQILRTLCCQSAPLPLRQVAALSRLPLFSVQRALGQLAQEKIVLRRREGRRVLFTLNLNHPSSTLLKEIFDLEMKSQIASASTLYHDRAESALEFSCSAQQLLERGHAWT